MIDHSEWRGAPRNEMHAMILCIYLGPIVHKARSGVYHWLARDLATAVQFEVVCESGNVLSFRKSIWTCYDRKNASRPIRGISAAERGVAWPLPNGLLATCSR
ncbi:predicted protein [Sclerotinia sclerotiorum 1980 UF-70]|uniref:Uncharacterized protein n=1 Tax=Sclerotinia sclerotiorum (strain ATCC 18683 / 1980 / Ss-1) TaxID=665079 RepID=A7EID7_SCLS1|nr:predicted protein [Sclerotinia sclerotiorum 1980 UF-70]EDO02603.1 predicted protein [Sclerotinia sclerotiorum 1980 UF-70]